MKALVCREFGPPAMLEFVDVDKPVPGPGQVVVSIAAAGVGFVDGLLVQGLYQVKPPLPYFPGSEFSGRIDSIGPGVTDVAVGDRVMGLAGGGAFAEYVSLDADACIALPDSLDDLTAAGFFVNYATALFGLRNCGDLMPGETVLVLGASGGVGSAAIAVAKAMGARVIAAASSEEKLAAARRSGADEGVNYASDDWRASLQPLIERSGLAMVYDPVGGDVAEPALRSLSPGGRFLVVGFASGTIPRIGLNLALLKRCSIVGVDWGGAARAAPGINRPLIETLLDWTRQGKLTPSIVVPRPFTEAREALADQLAGKIIGKLVLRIQD